jgi:homoserine dehydrogenase
MSVATAPETSALPSVRTIRLGLLGLGHVGQAVARLVANRSVLADAGLCCSIEHALVRDVDRARDCPPPKCVGASPASFLRGNYDVVIEALGTVEPARTLVTQLLGRGTAVVTANKALVAEHGAELERLAAGSGASFRFEATALSAVPFLGTLAARPLVASVDRLVAIVNGTSNFVLTSLSEEGSTFAAALQRAQQLGFAEPDPSRDVDGLDAADKLLLLTSLLGWGRLSRATLDVQGIGHLEGADLAAARSLGGTIKPIAFAQRDQAGVRAFVGPAFVGAADPLASLSGPLNGIKLDGAYVSNLFFSGPGAGPDVTAATLLDDVVQAATQASDVRHRRRLGSTTPVSVAAPVTSWFMRATFPGVMPAPSALTTLVSSSGLKVERVGDFATPNARWLLIGPHHRRDFEEAARKLESTHRIRTAAMRRI